MELIILARLDISESLWTIWQISYNCHLQGTVFWTIVRGFSGL